MNLLHFIKRDECECLNGDDDCHVLSILTKGPEFVESEVDEEVRQNVMNRIKHTMIILSLIQAGVDLGFLSFL